MQRVAERYPNLSEPHGTILATGVPCHNRLLSGYHDWRQREASKRYHMFLLVDTARTISLPNHSARSQRRRRRDVPQVSFLRLPKDGRTDTCFVYVRYHKYVMDPMF